MMKLKVLVGILIFLILLNLATIGSFFFYQLHEKEKKIPLSYSNRHMGGEMDSPRRPLRLNSEQRQKLKGLRQQLRKDTRELRLRIQLLRAEVFDSFQQDSVAIGEIEKKLEQIAQLRFQLEKKTIQNMLETKKYLTPEQQRAFYRLLWEFGDFRKGPHRVPLDLRMNRRGWKNQDNHIKKQKEDFL